MGASIVYYSYSYKIIGSYISTLGGKSSTYYISSGIIYSLSLMLTYIMWRVIAY